MSRKRIVNFENPNVKADGHDVSFRDSQVILYNSDM